MNLKHLTDRSLLHDTKTWVGRERDCISKVLWHLKEVDARKLYSDLRYSSLYDYCVQELGYSESSAQRRIVAARALRTNPEIAEKIQEGVLTLANVALVEAESKGATPEEKRQLFVRVENKTLNQAREEIAPETKVFMVRMDEETYRLWQQMIGLGVDFRAVVARAEAAKLSSRTKRTVFERDQRKCGQCGSRHRLEFDHRMPRSLGGTNEVENLRTLCRSCNQRKRIQAGLSGRRTKSDTVKNSS